MCITLHASQLSSTKLYAGEAIIDGRYVHVLGYQNNASNDVQGPNAMVLPLPAKVALGPANAIDTRGFPRFIGDIANSTKMPSYGDARSRGILKGMIDDSLSIFDVGSYTVVVGTNMNAAVSAVQELPAEKRPALNQDVLASMAGLYPGWAFAFCCWNGSIEPEPLLWQYEPRAPEMLFAPALDAHDGVPPGRRKVAVDHIVTFGSTLTPFGDRDVRYWNEIPAHVRPLLPIRAVGQQVQGKHANGDFWYPVRGFKERTYKMQRFFPGQQAEAQTLPLNQWS